MDETLTGIPEPCSLCDGTGKISIFKYIRFISAGTLLLMNFELNQVLKNGQNDKR